MFVPYEVAQLASGANCDSCSRPAAKAPIVSTTTSANGHFSLSNIPVADDVPLVIQKGGFRRVVHFSPQACRDNLLSIEQARLPRNHTEGDLPKIAIGVGDNDQVECLLRALGIADSEFSSPLGTGAIHLYSNSGPGGFNDSNLLGDLLRSSTRLMTYSMLFINCTNEVFSLQPNQPAILANLKDYAAAGGRLYVSDWAYDYLEQVPQFSPFITFAGGGDLITPQPSHAAAVGPAVSSLNATLASNTLTAWIRQAAPELLGSNGSVNLSNFVPTPWVEIAEIGRAHV